MLEELKRDVCEANKELVRNGLTLLTWDSVSGFSRKSSLMAITPAGVNLADLTPEQISIVDLGGKVVEGDLQPSHDSPTHLVLYRVFQGIGGIAHTHSSYATMFAQACREIPCLGGAHAGYFNGTVPVTRWMQEEEVEQDYQENTGRVIVERFDDLNPHEMPAVLVANHGPFTWGKAVREAVTHSIALEWVAKLAAGTFNLNDTAGPIPAFLLKRHFNQSHGPKPA